MNTKTPSSSAPPSVVATPTPNEPSLPVMPASAGPPPPAGEIYYQGHEFEYVAGPIRADLMDITQLSPTDLVLSDHKLIEGNEGRLVYTLPGVPFSEGFLVRSITNTGFGLDDWVSKPGLMYPAGPPGVGCYIFTAPGARSIQLPHVPPTPPDITNPIVTELSAEELLKVGWPKVNMERLHLIYRGVAYYWTASRYINDFGLDTSISPNILEELEILNIQYFIHVGPLPSPDLSKLVSDHTVTDRVRIYRFKDRPASEAIVVDQAPSDLIGYQFVYVQPKR